MNPNSPPRIQRSSLTCPDAPVTLEFSRFCGFACADPAASIEDASANASAAGVEEIHLIARPTADAPFEVQLDWLHRAYGWALQTLNLDPHTAVLRRCMCSDLAHQLDALRASPLFRPNAGSARADDSAADAAVSCVGQPPPTPAKIAMWAYHLRDPHASLDKRFADHTLTLTRGPLQHHWTCALTAPRTAAPHNTSASEQTRAALAAYERILHARNLRLADHVLRTWLFLPDIDADYPDFAAARREFFALRGLTPQTHYIVSTGIAGAAPDPAAKVLLDAYAVGGLLPQQLAYLKAADHLGHTDLYGVTFERGAAIRYRDRTHVLLAGTASIDEHGRTLHTGDLPRQVERTLDNIAALLSEAGATGNDLAVLIAYVRNLSDAPFVAAAVRERFDSTPLTVVGGAVCRPAWLVEIEGQAILPAHRPDLPVF